MPFNTAPALECFLPNISSTVCFPIRRALLRLAPRSALPALQRECQLRSSAFPNQTDNLSLRCFSRKSKNHCILFPDWCLHCYMAGGDRWCAFKSRSQPVIYSDLPLAHIWCPAVPFNTAPELECFLPNVSSTVCFPIRRALLRLVAHCLPCRERESASWEAQPFPTKPTSLSLRCFSRKFKNYSFSRLVPSLLHGGRWSLVCLQIPEPNCNLEWFAFCPHIMPSRAFQHCTSTWVLFAKYFKHSMLPHQQSVAKTGRGHPGRTWCWSQLFKFSSDARIIWITSRCQYLFLFHATPNPASQASSSKNAQEQ